MRQKLERGGDGRDQELVWLMVVIKRLSDALEQHVNILREGRCGSVTTEKGPNPSLRDPLESKQVLGVHFWRTHFTTTSSWMNLSLACLGLFSCLSRVVWAESFFFGHDPSQAASPWFVQDVCAAQVLNPRVRKGKALIENQGYDGACMMDWMTGRERCHHFFDTGLNSIENFNGMSEDPVDMFVHVSICMSVSLIPAHGVICTMLGGEVKFQGTCA